MMSSSSPPKVFVSYSHDSEQHKNWVRLLAERLRSDGIDIVLDQWEIGPGDDVTSFMERALSSCHRALIICTNEYIRKANMLKGGVGYERMIITAEIAQRLKTRKFIPILRAVHKKSLPKFLGPRIYVDLQKGELDRDQYDILLRELLGVPKHEKPPVGLSPYTRPQKEESGMKIQEQWPFHWHRAVHEYCGYKLHLIFVRFTMGSIFMSESIIDDLESVHMSNFMIFHLYSVWDILIRVWADDEMVQKLKGRFNANPDINKQQQPEFLVVQDLTHFPETGKYAKTEDVITFLNKTGLALLQEVQNVGQKSEHFDQLRENGLILVETVGFHPDRIQFYITIRSIYSLESPKLNSLRKLVAEKNQIRNKTIYITVGSPIGAVVKGQAENYYDIYDFLKAITKELESVEVMTETMLVANKGGMSTLIDFNIADRHILEREIDTLLPELGRECILIAKERYKLVAKYVEIREKLTEDKQGLLIGLIRAKARGSAGDVGQLLTFFPPFEQRLKQKLVQLVMKLYGNDWQKTLDDLKAKEGLTNKELKSFVFGDLCKVYKQIVLCERIIDIAPLTEEDFRTLMDVAPEKRNKFAHTKPDLKGWDDLFSFCSKFIPIYSRLLAYLDTLKN